MGLLNKSLRSKAALALTTSVGLLIFMSAPNLRANNDDCQHHVAKVDHQLHEAIEHHGSHSEEAEHWRHELREARERCWIENHRWWDEDNHRWRMDRDWDNHDHDRD